MNLRAMPLLALFCLGAGSAAASTVRVACDGPAANAEVSVNGKFRGECPIDIQVNAGKHKITAKKVIAGKTETFEMETRLGDGVAKRVEIVFENVTPAAQALPLQVDPQVIARERYQAELAEYERSVAACLPKHAEELRRVRQIAQEDLNAYARECRARARREGKPDDWSWEKRYYGVCGELTLEAREFSSFRTPGEKELGRFTLDPKKWCEAQFTKPIESK